jgi:hypothetical protein
MVCFRFKVLMVVKMSLLSWVVTVCGLLGSVHRFGEMWCLKPSCWGRYVSLKHWYLLKVDTALQPTNTDIIEYSLQIIFSL